MYEKFLSADAESFRQRYEGTYGFYRGEDGKRLLVMLTHIRDQTCYFKDVNDVEYELNADSKKNIGFEFLPPKASYYNSDDGSVFLVRRIAARQFQRGLTGRNIEIFKLDKSNALLPQKVNFDTLSKIFDKSVMPDKLVGNLKEGLPLAVSGQIAVTKTAAFLFERAIGSAKNWNGTTQIKLDEPELWRTEIKDAFRNIGKTVEVM